MSPSSQPSAGTWPWHRVEAVPHRAAVWAVWSTHAFLAVRGDERSLAEARRVVDAELAAVDVACSRFRPDSELVRLAAAGGRRVAVSALLAEYLRAALDVAAVTGGDVDPTVGASLRAVGYDRDIADLQQRGAGPVLRVARLACWTDVDLDLDAGTVQLPAGVELDLGATAKAYAADRSARQAADRTGRPVLVGLGGDLAVAGTPGDEPWTVRVAEDDADPSAELVAVGAGGLATSSTTGRRWRAGSRTVHHVLDPRTGLPAREFWRTVTVAAGSCLDANAAATAALVRGPQAQRWLVDQELPARLVRADGTVTTLAGWPAEPAASGGVR